MRMLVFTERFPPDIGGVARSAERTVWQLTRLGVACDVFCWTKTLPPGQLESVTIRSECHEATLHRLGLFANADFSMQHTINVIEWLHEETSYDAIWGHYLQPAGFVAVVLARTLGIPSTVSARGNDVDRLMFPPGDFARLEWTIRSADLVTAVSRDLAKKIHMIANDVVPEVVHNSVDVGVFCPSPPDATLREALGIYPQESVLGFCGELRQKKGLPFLCRALQDVRRERAACLLVVGQVRERDKRALLDYLGDDPETRKRVLVTGELTSPSDVAVHLNLCDAMLFPSVWDGFPNAILEAMSCERLVVASDAGGIPEMIEHRENGIMLPRAQLHRLGEAVLECLDLAPKVRHQMGRAARRCVMERFHAERESQALASLMTRLVPNTSR